VEIFKTKPYDHQLQAYEIAKDEDYFAFLMDMGTGKTKVVLDIATYRYRKGKIDGLFVIAPNGVHTNWIRREIVTHLNLKDTEYKTLLYKSAKSGTKKFKEDWKELLEFEGLAIFAMNVESWSGQKGIDFGTEFFKKRKTYLALDESAKIKNMRSKRTKNIIKHTKDVQYKAILTGTPVTQGPFDIHSQFMFLSPDILGITNHCAFRNKYAVIEKRVNFKTKGVWEEVLRYRHLSQLKALIKPHSFRVKKEDCLDLPEKMYQVRTFEMSKNQLALYKQAKQALLFSAEGRRISITNVLVEILRLQQITGGFLPNKEVPESMADYDVIDPDTSIDITRKTSRNPKMKALLDSIEEAPGKVIIWARFTFEIHMITEKLREIYGHSSTVVYNGEVSEENRDIAIDKFQDKSSKTRFFVANPAAGSEGITLTAGTTVIYYSNTYSFEKRAQSEDRAHRIGQDNKVLYIDITAEKTIDEAVLLALKSKEDMSVNMMGGLRGITKGEYECQKST